MLSQARFSCVVSFGLLGLGLSGCSDGPRVMPTNFPKPSNQVVLIAHTTNSDINRLTISVTVCAPGTSDCQTIDNIMVDTGSVGLRLQSSAMKSSFLPVKLLADGSQLGECELFGGGDAWGMVSLADVQIGGAKAANMQVQVIGSDSTRQPPSCRSGAHTSNGTLGIGIGNTDCKDLCTMPALYTTIGSVYRFFSCSSTSCTGIRGNIPAADQLPNPTAVLDGGIYNGAVLDLPAVPGGAADQVVGTLTFGVNTSTDNMLTGASFVALNDSGNFTTEFNGTSFPSSYIDSGTEYYGVASSIFTPCNPRAPYGSFCVSPVSAQSATIVGDDNYDVPFHVGIYPQNGVSDGAAAYGGAGSQGFVWGAPFFFGKRVAVVRRGQTVGLVNKTGPLYAWQPTTLQ